MFTPAAGLAFILLTGSPALTEAAPAPQTRDAQAPTRIEPWPLEKVSRLGDALYRQDNASARGTDALVARFGQAGLPQDLRGWITIPEDRSHRVRFVAERDGRMVAAYDIVVVGERAGAVEDADGQPLSAEQQAMFDARLTAASNIGALRCTPRYNPVVMKDPEGDGWLVWLLASTNDPNQVIMTGHYRFRVSADGKTVLNRDQLSASCVTQPRPPAGAQSVGLVVSHIVSDLPVETHVFTSLLYRQPVYVAIGDKIWNVNGARIREVRQ